MYNSLFLNQFFFYKVIWYIKWRTLPMPGCSGLYGPRGSRTHLKPKSGYPCWRLRSSTFHSFETPQEPKMLKALNDLARGLICTLQQVPTSTTRPNTFHFWNRVPFHFFGQKSQKVDLKVPFSVSKNSIIFNDILERDSCHKSDNFFCLQIFENIWNFNIFKKKNLIPPWATIVICIS